MAYIARGDLYIQDSPNPPMQLTHNGEVWHALLSEDGEKAVFSRGKVDDDDRVYSINADGSQEQALITPDWLNTLRLGTKATSLAFVPGTHQLLFDTYLCPGELSAGCTTGIFMVDTDTAEVREILHPLQSGYLPWGGGTSWHGNFAVSPDGKLLSVAISGGIHIFRLDGNVTRRNIMLYRRSTPIELFPRMFWLPDSSGLIVALPAESHYGATYEMTPTYTVWRYDLDKEIAGQIPFNPAPIWIYMECSDVMYLSPDGNRIVFNRSEADGELYQGDLGTGYIRPYPMDSDCLPTYWSADSKHFIVYGHTTRTSLGSVDNKSLIPVNGNFLGWVDTTHFMYSHFPNEEEVLVGEIHEESITTYATGVSLQEGYSPYLFTLVDHKTNQ